MTRRTQSEYAIAAEAAQWHARQGHLSPREQCAFSEWLKASPRHVREFLMVETLADELRHVDPQRRHDVEALLAAPPDDIVALPDAGASHAGKLSRPRPWNRRAIAIAAAVCGVAVLTLAGMRLPQWLGGWQTFTTAVGEQRVLQLADDSVVNLNTGSRLQVHISDRMREMRLLEGEAFFKVRQDAGRPFRVYTRDAVIQAIGTQFNVHRRTHDTRVAVVEGRVRVVPAVEKPALTPPDALGAGEEVQIGADGRIKQRARPDVINVVAWRQRRLVFREETLTEIAAEFNRYNQAPKFRLEGVDGKTQHYTGTFDADNPQAMASLLSQQSDLDVQTTDKEIVVRPR